MADLKRYTFRLARTTQEQRDAFAGADLGFLSEHHDGDLCQAADALREITTRDARIAELEAELKSAKNAVFAEALKAKEVAGV